MHNNDIEKELKNSADKITVKSYSERRNNIKDRILTDDGNQEILVGDTVLSGIENNIVNRADHRKRNLLVAVLSLVLCCIAVLAVVLPITLKKDEPAYFKPADLITNVVDREQFFSEIDNCGYDVIDFTAYEITACNLLTADGKIKGGSVEIVNDDAGYILNINFYDETVTLPYKDVSGYKLYSVNSTEIKYNTLSDDSLYLTDACAKHNSISYEITIISITEDCTFIFDELFS